MSWLSSGLKKLGHVAAPVVHRLAQAGGTAGGFLLGGPAGAMAGYRLGDKIGNIEQDALAGKNVRTNLGSNLLGAGEGGAGLYGASGGFGGGGNAGGVPQVTRDGQPITLSDVNPNIPEDGASNAGDGWLKKAIGSVTGPGEQPGGTNPWLLGLAGLEGANSAYLGQKANSYAGQALKSVTDSYNARAGLRNAGINGLLHPAAPDVSTLQTIQSRNPYAAPTTPQPGILQARLKGMAL
jgi:hypothetical protein